MDLTNQRIEDTYGNVLTIGTTAGTPTSGILENGAGQRIQELTLKSIKFDQIPITAAGTDITTSSIVDYGVSIITATASDYAIRLPEPSLGGVVNIVNTSTVNVFVFPYDSNDAINGLADGEHYVIPPDGAMYTFNCTKNPTIGNWSVSTPTQNNTITKTVSANLTADGTYFDAVAGESYASQTLLEASKTTYYPAGAPYSVLNAPASTTDYFDTQEFDTYNEVRIIELTVKSNVPAGDLTGNASQISSTLMGITNTQLFNCFGFIRKATLSSDGTTTFTTNEYNNYRFDNTYSSKVNAGTSTGNISHYADSTGTLYQQLIVPTPNADWITIDDVRGNRNVWFAPYIGYGSAVNSTPYTSYPTGFEFTAEIIVKFEFR